jgi:hypothetical protein
VIVNAFAVISKDVSAGFAGAYVESPACVARNWQVPTLNKVTVAPETDEFGTVQIDGVKLVIVTCKLAPGLTLVTAVAVGVSPYTLLEIGVHVST